jgi:hypothetical protein
MAQTGSSNHKNNFKNIKNVIKWLLLIATIKPYKCSEFPDRECCDPVFPFDANEPEPPILPTTTISSSSHEQQLVGTEIERAGENGQILPGRSGKNFFFLFS